MLKPDESFHPVMLALNSREEKSHKRSGKAAGLSSKTGATGSGSFKTRFRMK